MAIDFTKAAPKGNVTKAAEERTKAKFWLNIGYNVETEENGEKVDTFVALPVGIPLDMQDKLAVRSSNADFAALQTARNELLEQLVEYAGTLEPGDEQILSLQIQLRRVREEPAPIASKDNKFSAKIQFN